MSQINPSNFDVDVDLDEDEQQVRNQLDMNNDGVHVSIEFDCDWSN
jgi:hypothetical protein